MSLNEKRHYFYKKINFLKVSDAKKPIINQLVLLLVFHDHNFLWYVMYKNDDESDSNSTTTETDCGIAVVTENSATLQFIGENDDGEPECTVIVLSR